MPDLVSIVIPCFNAERWIASAIQSALDQTWPEKEVLVIDDGSTDGSLTIIESFGDRIHRESGLNRGGNVARNRGLALAKGAWIQFLDGDDYLEPVKIENQLMSLSSIRDPASNSVDIIYSPVKVEEWRGTEKTYYAHEIDTSVDLYAQWIRWQVAQTGAVLWRTEALRSIGGWNEQMPCCQDNEVVMRAIQKGLRFFYYPQAEAIYRHWSQGTVCRKNPEKVIRVRTDLLVGFIRWLRENGLAGNEHRAEAGRACFEMARTLAAKCSIHEAARYHKEMKRVGLISPGGAAFPRGYAWMYRWVGFTGAERLARMFRSSGGA